MMMAPATSLKDVAIKEPTQVPFGLHYSTIESGGESDSEDDLWGGNNNDDSDYVAGSPSPNSRTSLVNSEKEELQEFHQVRITLDDHVMRATTSFRTKAQREEYKARNKKKFMSVKDVYFDLLDALDVRAEFLAHLRYLKFRWLMNTPRPPVPREVVLEFFTMFHSIRPQIGRGLHPLQIILTRVSHEPNSMDCEVGDRKCRLCIE